MTPEELLKPRWKVIADYPNSPFIIGQIFVIPNFDKDFTKKYWADDKDKYPHLFQRLEWWEERKPDEMPEYLKCLSPVFKWSKGDIIKVSKWIECFGPSVRFYTDYTDKVTHSPFSFIPAAEADYTAYINQQH